MGNQGQRSEHHLGLLRAAREVLPGGILGTFVMPDEFALVLDRGRGSKVYDADGNEYIDYVLGSGPLVLGHAHPSVVRAVKEQIDKGTTFYALNEPAIRLAQLMVEAVPCAERVRFASSGSEVTFYALRMARAFTGREKVLKFEGAYHGHHDYAMMGFTSQSPSFPRPTFDTAGIPRCLEETVLIAPFNDQAACEEIITRNRDDLAAVIVEPYQRVYGPKDGFLEFLREITRRYGIVLVFDELVTGFRIAFGGAQEVYGVTPDLATYGKIMAGGYPLSAVCGRADIMDLCDPARKVDEGFVYQSGTLNGNAVCAAAGVATMEELKRPRVYQRLNELGERIRGHLETAFARKSIPVRVVGIGPMFNVLFTEEEITDFRSLKRCDKKRQLSFVHGVFRRGLFVDPRGIRSYISAVHTEEDLEKTFRIFDESIEEMNL